ncbi:MAG TPA: nucleoside hydrolase [Terracidiphilus sp.]|jgi:inosine-uridine nucleoside N-ribohydrolase|nr:nucleoside hydrolase [Terracidiphilus sp.]
MAGMKNVPQFFASALVFLMGGLMFQGTERSCRAQDGQTGQGSAQPQLVLIDTDIGDDIDDAFALALALRSPELKILGVTTTFGDTEMRARLLDRYLKAVGRSDIPVAAGPPSKTDNVLTQRAYALQAPAVVHADGAAFLLDQIRKHPEEITLIAIGPLFTVQAALSRDPDTFRKLKRVVMMGGSIERGYDGKDGQRRPPDAEWNINRNPAGAQALLAAGVPIFMMPLDSTQIHLQAPERKAIFSHGSPLTDQLTLLYHQWMAGTESHSPAPTLFDPVAVTYTFRPDLCPTKPLRIEVDDKGFTRPVAGEPNVQVCMQSDEQGFLKLLLDRIAEK